MAHGPTQSAARRFLSAAATLQRSWSAISKVGHRHVYQKLAVSKGNLGLVFKAMVKKSEAKQMFAKAKHTVTEPGS
jgi:hypothetical protein